jgi:hypothetical protein
MRDAEEPDRRVDALADWVVQHEPGLAKWAIEALAGALWLDVLVLDDDDLARVRGLGEALGDAIRYAHRIHGTPLRDLVGAALEGVLTALGVVDLATTRPAPRVPTGSARPPRGAAGPRSAGNPRR